MDAVSAAPLNVEKVREDFPILSEQIHGKPLVYVDNAASAQKPKAVLDRIQQAYAQDYSNVHRGLHTLANRSTEAYEGAREIVRAHLGAARAYFALHDLTAARANFERVLALAAGPFAKINRDTFAAIGVARISLGSALAKVTHASLLKAARGILNDGDFSELLNGASGDEIEALLTHGRD